MSDDIIVLAIDTELRRPGCALVQATLGCPGTARILCMFDPVTWLTVPTDAMVRIRGTRAQWEGFAKACNAAAKWGAPPAP